MGIKLIKRVKPKAQKTSFAQDYLVVGTSDGVFRVYPNSALFEGVTVAAFVDEGAAIKHCKKLMAGSR